MNRTLFALATSVLLAGALGVSCGDNEPDDSNPGATGGSNPGAGGMEQGGSGAGESSCASSQELCGDFCASTASDPLNCGSCGLECGAGEGCMDGECLTFDKCTTGQVICDDACTNLQADRNHCGACGSACDSGEVCDNGLCATSCTDGRIECGGGCVDPMTDRLYCGATDCDAAAGGAGGSSGGESCADGEVCTAGSCTTSCPAGQIICDNRCITPASDRDFCGATDCSDQSTNGVTCATGEVCGGGVCATSCPAGQIVCGNTCVDPEADRQFCGATDCSEDSTDGEVCLTGEVCGDGVCATSCPVGQIICDGRCVTPASDRDFCGATDCSDESTSGVTCATGEVCGEGFCTTSCPADQIVCGTTCVDPETDRRFCGATDCSDESTNGEACADSMVCSEGACEASCAAGYLDCNGTCIDPDSNNQFCGATDCSVPADSGESCSTEESCQIGQCRTFLFDWSTGVPISADGISAGNGQVLGTDAVGNTLVVFKQYTGADESSVRLYSRRYLFSTKTWTPIIRVDVGVEEQARNQQVAVAPNGDAYVVWDTNGEIYGAAYDGATNTWHTLERLDDAVGTKIRETPTLDIDDLGNAWVAWSEEVVPGRFRIVRTYFDRANDSLTIPEVVDTYGENDAQKSYLPQISMNGDGDVVIVWRDEDTADGDLWRSRVIATVKKKEDAMWSTPTELTAGPRIHNDFGAPDVGIDDEGNAYVVWADAVSPKPWPDSEDDFDSNIVMRKIEAGTPGAMTLLESIDGRLRRPQIATDKDGNSVVTYFHGDYTFDTMGPWTVFATRIGSDLSSPQTSNLRVIPDGSGGDDVDPSVVSDGAGNSHVTWVVKTGAETSSFNVGVDRWGGYESLSPPSVSSPGVSPATSAASGGRAYATWYAGGRVYFARYD